MPSVPSKSTAVFAGVLLALGASAGVAQYVGPSSTTAYKSVAEILKNPIDDAPVLLEGYLIRNISKDKYIFTDGTAQIQVDIDRRHFPSTPITDKTRVRVRGEVEKDFLESPEIDVDFLSIVN